MTPHTRRKLLHYWVRHIRPILILVLVFTAARSSILDWNDVPTGSMNPTIFDGDRIFVNKLAYGLKFPYTTWQLATWSNPRRGEIVVFYSPEDGTRLVKRLVAVPGDHLVVHNGRLIINDKPVSYTPYFPASNAELPPNQQTGHSFFIEDLNGHKHIVAFWDARPQMREYEIKLGPDQYFMMGDNRDNSRDSRWIGPAPRRLILGRSSRIMFSLDYDDHFLPRKDRFFKALP